MLTPTLILVAHLLGTLSAVHALHRTRTTQGTIAWVVSLLSLPYLAVPAYWVFGRSRFQGYVSARQAADHFLEQVPQGALERLRHYQLPESQKSSAAWAAERLADVPLTVGNNVELLIDGQRTFESILAGIDQAEHYILFQFFIVKDDELGQEVKKHLLAKASQGVEIYFLYDEVGSNKLGKRYLNELRAAGIQVSAFHTQKGMRNRFQLNFRNHRKIVVVDGRTTWVGGHNVGDEYLGRDAKFGHWRDTHVRIEGPATLATQLSFVEDWNWATGDILKLNWQAHRAHPGESPVLVIPSGPADELETASLMFLHAINSAQHRIWIASPYFVPDEATLAALQLAGLRGVDVRILIPDKPDHLLVYLAAFSYFDEASETGVRIYRYLDGFLHQKVMLVDDRASAVGTANFDNRSFRLNFEVTAVIGNPEFSKQIEGMLYADFEKSRLMQPGETQRHSFAFQLAVRLARLLSPIL